MELSNERILITGASGCVGMELLRQFSEKYECLIKALIRDSNKKDDILSLRNVEVIYCDITDKALIDNIIKDIDIVIHLAAKVHTIETSSVEADEFFNVNTLASENIFRACLKHGVKRLIFFSTVAVYGETGDHVVDENTPCLPQTAYAKSKFEAENKLNQLYNEFKIPCTILRLTTVFGRGDRGNIKSIIKLVQKGLMLSIGKGRNIKTFIYVKDIMNAVECVLKNDNTIGQTFILRGFNICYNDILKTIGTLSNKKTPMLRFPTFLADLLISISGKLKILTKVSRKLETLKSNNIYSGDKLSEYTGFKPQYGFEEGLRDCIDYYSK